MAKPFSETVNIQPQTVSTGQAQLQQGLGEILDNFASQAASFAAQKTVERATVQGQQAGLEQQQAGAPLELKEETFIGGIGKKAFNQAAREGYLKSLDNDNIEAITTISAENATNLAGFNDEVNAYAKGVMENVDPASKAAVALSIDSMVSRQRPKIQAAQAKAVVDQANQDQAINATERSRLAQSSSFEGDAEQAGLNLALAIDSINNRSDLNNEQKAKQIREVQLEEREAFNSGELSRTYDNEGAGAALDQLSEMDGNPPKGFTPDEWDKFISQEHKKINRRISREKKQTKEGLDAAKLAASVARGSLFTDPSIPADPAGSSQDRKDINNFYDAESQAWASLPPQEQIDLNVGFVNDTGLVPKQMISNVNAAMRSGTVDQVALMTDYMSRIQEETPGSLKDIPEESRAIALQVSDAQRAGMDVDVALEQARKTAFGLTDSERDVIRTTTQEVSKALPGVLQDAVDLDVDEGGFDTGIFSRVPDVPPMMLADYRNSFSRFMEMTGGNSEQSQKLAFQSAKSVWGVTETGGPKRFSKYAPETIYAVHGSNNNWIEEQFNSEMEVLGAEGAVLAIDKSTARETQPSYPVFVPNGETGILEPLRNMSADPKIIERDARFGELGQIKNKDGSISTEFSITENVPELGGWVNIPSLVKGQADLEFLETKKLKPENVKIAINRAIERKKGGAILPSFDSMDEALKAARSRPESVKMSPFGNRSVTWRPDYKLTDEYQKLAGAPTLEIANAKKQRKIDLQKRANVIANGIQARVLNREFIPFNERADFLKSDQGKEFIGQAVDGMLQSRKIDEVEAKEARRAFGI